MAATFLCNTLRDPVLGEGLANESEACLSQSLPGGPVTVVLLVTPAVTVVDVQLGRPYRYYVNQINILAVII